MSGTTADTIYKRLWIKGDRPLRKLLPAVSIAVFTVTASFGCVASVHDSAIAAEVTPSDASANLQPDREPLDLDALDPAKTPAGLITAARISLTRLTIPSLWWLQTQIASEDAYGSKLLADWLAYPNSGNRPGRVDLVVNRQFWSLLDYLDRYAFIHVFGEAARDYGYNVRVFDGQATLLGASTCDFSNVSIDALQKRQLAERANPSDRVPFDINAIACSILLDSSGKGGLRGGSRQPGAGAAKALDILQP
ncbi:hypothetical protein [Stenomitos frigidus]|uniref:Uncharacterized protein n=1 Tax=Stenomitos frigidus ULC18 TaxID=2107698 RepID=A0A2T1DZD9_9CYAN|nr:hypothetical protein [Stenomitos frigidus]PSB25860.1 hypothetical protein C7B82_21620 [Stenomitos frigidus ULC18]